MAHTAGGALHFGVEDQKLAAVWNYQTSPLFSAAERAALDLAVAGASVPNAATDEMFIALRKHWNDEQIVEMSAPSPCSAFSIGGTTRSPHRWKMNRFLSVGRNILPPTAGPRGNMERELSECPW